eukprot:CAMPEP_0196765942 /NCGR_PEP_ID=MMETSP1095-20130614/15663_1 /TAXON_ID=96789 ORGANISM="Chromulina nebulosa, Strain UTEXLB2642" /NCGR_SAMPLE_ID=MMETSP1095 /ASSEMBLY_ACC=CAM_ASM_000446 /LENGTH=353 /DNA_ID=CAMNT_0042125369 /DNA_START=32 /DNA_END=1089 /DNA_ORIENTATION=-
MIVKSGESVLIVQNKGGGHGSIGYQLSKTLLSQYPGAKVSILQDKCSYSKEPFSSYNELESLGVSIVVSELTGSNSGSTTFSSIEGIKGKSYDYVIDNWSKDEKNATFVADIAKNSATKQLIFISSAGMYSGIPGLQPLVETDSVKSSNGPRKVETVYEKAGIPFTFLRPQYIYGNKISKRYLDFFIGRIVRKLPVPVPLSGDQLVCLTNLEDTAGLISAAIGHPAAFNEVFNAGTDRYISYKGLISIIDSALGHETASKILSYDPKNFPEWDGKEDVAEFPFRKETFITSVNKAKDVLNWSPTRSLAKDVKGEVDEYLSSSKAKDTWSIKQLRYDFEIIASKDPSALLTTYP